jgi:hypothetical protein
MAGVAAYMRAGQFQSFANEMDQQHSWLDVSLPVLPVHFHMNR